MILPVLIATAIAVWAWRAGNLGRDQLRWGWAAAGVFLGVEMAVRGRPLFGAAIAALGVGAALWKPRVGSGALRSTLAVDEARAILGVGIDADRAAIRAAHRRIVRSIHPDRGGDPELAARVNAARDCLLDDLKRR